MKNILPYNSRILVTGGAGFIGSNLCEALLKAGHFVRCMDDFSTGKRENIEPFLGQGSFELLEQDIRDLDACIDACYGMDYVLHQAAWGSVPRSIEYPLLYEEINIKGTLNLLEAARQKGVKRFVYASSSSVYGDSATLPKKEGGEGKVLSPYAFTKKACEEYARLYSSLYGLETVGLRYFNVFGRQQDPNGVYAAVIPKFISLMLKGEVPTINGDGRQSRDFTYIDNVVQANLRACVAGAKASGESFNIAHGGQITLLEMMDILNSKLGTNISPRFAPDRNGDIKHSNADIGKAKALLGYDPQIDFDEGISLAIAYYREAAENG